MRTARELHQFITPKIKRYQLENVNSWLRRYLSVQEMDDTRTVIDSTGTSRKYDYILNEIQIRKILNDSTIDSNVKNVKLDYNEFVFGIESFDSNEVFVSSETEIEIEMKLEDIKIVDAMIDAKDLYAYLGMKGRNYTQWIEDNLLTDSFSEGCDYAFQKMQDKKVYTITLDTAKSIALMSRSERGKQFRLYFIEAEKQLRTVKPMNQLEMISYMATQMNEQNIRTSQIESRINKIEQTHQKALAELNCIERSTNDVPEIGTRLKINQIVRNYCDKHTLNYQDVWRNMYNKMIYVYRFNVNKYKLKHPKESKMDIIERENQLDNLFSLVSKELV